MSVYALINDGAVAEYPVYEGDIRLRHSNISWPQNGFTPPEDYAYVLPEDMPVVDHTKNVIEGAPEYSANGWHQVWVVVDASAAEIDQRVAVEWSKVRTQRNGELQATDWTQLNDAPADKAAHEVYRQQLRDVTTQSDPFNLIWPVKP
jgi:hypothetical protein